MKESDKNQPKNPVTYSTYLKVSELIALQEPLSNPMAHDEMLFIIIHQTYELWFKQTLFEMKALVSYLEKDNLIQSYRILERISEIFKVLVQQIDILETMSPVEFNQFRSHLNPASGFQSGQFRELELLAGADPASFSRLAGMKPEWEDKILNHPPQTSLRDALFNLLARKKLIDGRGPDEIRRGLLEVYHRPENIGLHKLCESLIGFDEQLLLWRFRHIQMVERMIGMKMGTGGSLGVPYLTQTLKKKFFPELWELRTHLDGAGY